MSRRMAVLGFPIEHSLSPIVHSKAAEILGISFSYERFAVRENELAGFLAKHNEPQWRGFSLTMPLKEEGFKLGHPSDKGTELTGVANTLVNSSRGWLAYNTDISGFEFLLEPTEYKSVSILGTGGTARAALFAIGKEVEEIEIFRRSAKNDELCLAINSRIVFRDWSDLADAFDNDLLINATSASANNEIRQNGRRVKIALDAVYAPWPPPLLDHQQGAAYFSGKDLLVAQALDQVSIFNEVSFNKRELYKAIRGVI